MGSVEQWAARSGYGYETLADELFNWVAPERRKKLMGRTPILADLARLRWIESVLSQRGGLVVWIDADSLCLDPSWRLPGTEHTFFGEECWVQKNAQGRWRTYCSPHNAFMGFTSASPVLAFLAYLSESIIDRADPTRIAPQMIGPKLLKTLNSLADFTLVPEAGAVSPALLAEWVGERGAALACYERASRPPLAMVNLCSSLVKSVADTQHVTSLLDKISG
jgi:hypothetical protein